MWGSEGEHLTGSLCQGQRAGKAPKGFLCSCILGGQPRAGLLGPVPSATTS